LAYSTEPAFGTYSGVKATLDFAPEDDNADEAAAATYTIMAWVQEGTITAAGGSSTTSDNYILVQADKAEGTY